MIPSENHVRDKAGRPSGKVKYWDLGPAKPVAAEKPDAPTGKDGDPEYELAKMDFKDKLEQYHADIKNFGALKTEFARWTADKGGPFELNDWAYVAQNNMVRNAERYVWALPKGAKPGHGDVRAKQAEQKRLDSNQAFEPAAA